MEDKEILKLMKESSDQGKTGKELMDLRAKVASELTSRSKTPEEAAGAIRRYKKILDDARKRAIGAMGDKYGEGLAPPGSKFTKTAAKGVKSLAGLAAPLAGLYAAFSSGDASAAIPILGSAEPVGQGSDDVGYTEEQLKKFRRRKPRN